MRRSPRKYSKKKNLENMKEKTELENQFKRSNIQRERTEKTERKSSTK